MPAMDDKRNFVDYKVDGADLIAITRAGAEIAVPPNKQSAAERALLKALLLIPEFLPKKK